MYSCTHSQLPFKVKVNAIFTLQQFMPQREKPWYASDTLWAAEPVLSGCSYRGLNSGRGARKQSLKQSYLGVVVLDLTTFCLHI
jgi:hypothetical protein